MMNVYTSVEESGKGSAFQRYWLHIIRDDDSELKIPLADLSVMGGGISLAKWKKTTRNGRKIVGVYLEMNIMGHELDQWAYFDLETGDKIK